MKRVLLVTAYDGTEFAGFQAQKSGVRTVEGVLNEVLGSLTGEDIEVIGASRTDAGVHALCNLAVFDTGSRIPGDKFAAALNTRLPEDVKIQESFEVDPDFHPRHCMTIKTYEYRIYNAPFPSPVYGRNPIPLLIQTGCGERPTVWRAPTTSKASAAFIPRP